MLQSPPRRALCALAIVCSFTPGLARALTLDEALERALERAPEVVRARARIGEMRGAVVSAELPVREDPVFEASGGPRYTADGEWIPQLQVGIEQQLELSGARGARIDVARAGVERAEASSREAVRAAIASVGAAFVDALHARDAYVRAGEVRERVTGLLETGEARFAAGDVGAIEVRRLRLAAAQVRSEEHAARAALEVAAGRVRALLDLSQGEPLEIEGTFAEVARPRDDAPTPRPELDALRAAIREAGAERRLAEALSVPELGVGVGYQLEEGDHMGLVTLSVTLPFFDRGQGARLAADARRDALEAELALRERAITSEVATAREALAATSDALDESARAVADATELDAMLRRSWEAGETSLTELLVVRAEVQSAVRAHLDHARDAGLARVALEAALGSAR